MTTVQVPAPVAEAPEVDRRLTDSAPADPLAAAVPVPRTGAEPDWRPLVEGVLRHPDRLRLVVQPIVGLAQAAVVGYEALARFEGPSGLTPDRWFAAADALGLGADLEAVALRAALELRESLPPGCFLTANVSPHLLAAPAVRDLLLGAVDLRPLVLEMTEHHRVDDLGPVVLLRDRLATQGALLALDDAGSGYSGLQQMTRLRPHLVKLDRSLVSDIDTDEVKRALAELLGQLAGRLDAWLLAEGVETWGELETFLRLEVPLAQGYLLARPGPPWPRVAPDVVARLRRSAAQTRLVENVTSLAEPVPVEGVDPLPPGRVGLRVDADGVPVALLLPLQRLEDTTTHGPAPVSLRVPASDPVLKVVQRAMTRPAVHRFDPVVVADRAGRAVGVVRVERLVLRLAALQPTSRRAHDQG